MPRVLKLISISRSSCTTVGMSLAILCYTADVFEANRRADVLSRERADVPVMLMLFTASGEVL